MDIRMVLYGAEALVLVLSVVLALLFIRKHAPRSKLRLWVVLAGFAGAVYLVLKIFNVPGESTFYKITLAAVIFLSANIVLKMLNLLFWDYLLWKRADVHIPRLIIDIINAILLALVALGIFNGIFGVRLSGLLVTSTVLSAVIGLSLQDILGNLFAGLALQMERPYNLGEWISLREYEGIVVQMNWRTLTLRTRNGDSVIVPNATVSKEVVTNHSRPDRNHMCRVHVGVSYGCRPEKVKEALLSTVAGMGGVLEKPPPEVLQLEFGDFSIVYEVRFWINEFYRKPELESTAKTRIWYVLRRRGMTIPFPIRDVNMRRITSKSLELENRKRREEIFRLLRKIELFDPLSDSQLEDLAESASAEEYAAGESLVRQGDPGDSLYVMVSGKVEVTVEDAKLGKIHVAFLKEGDYFGEMSLLTGEPRSATVTAVCETRVIKVPKEGISGLLEEEESILEPLSAMLDKRLKELSSRAAENGAREEKERQAVEHKDRLLNRIRLFFGMR